MTLEHKFKTLEEFEASLSTHDWTTLKAIGELRTIANEARAARGEWTIKDWEPIVPVTDKMGLQRREALLIHLLHNVFPHLLSELTDPPVDPDGDMSDTEKTKLDLEWEKAKKGEIHLSNTKKGHNKDK